MRKSSIAVLALLLAPAAAAQSLGDKLARDACIPQALYYMTAPEQATYAASDVSGVYRPDGNTERWFHHRSADGTSGAYCLQKALATGTCQRAVVCHVQNVLAICGPWTNETC